MDSKINELNEVLEKNFGLKLGKRPNGDGYRLFPVSQQEHLIIEIPANHIDVKHYSEYPMYKWRGITEEIYRLMISATHPMKLGTHEMTLIEPHPLYGVLYRAIVAGNQPVIDFLLDEMEGINSIENLHVSYRMPSKQRILDGVKLKIEAARKRGEL